MVVQLALWLVVTAVPAAAVTTTDQVYPDCIYEFDANVPTTSSRSTRCNDVPPNTMVSFVYDALLSSCFHRNSLHTTAQGGPPGGMQHVYTLPYPAASGNRDGSY
jgi:hypothetical protein